jgi:hypothetical protein
LIHQLYTQVSDLPETWDQVSASCIFLQRSYLGVLEKSAPANMQNTFVGVFDGDKLVGTALFQEIDLAQLSSFGERDHFLLTQVRNFLFRQFASKLLIVGNNLLSGQNAYACLPEANEIPFDYFQRLYCRSNKTLSNACLHF